MKNYTVDQIRTMFLEFFQSKDHRILPSASLIPHGDPTLLLTVAGMVPFKRYFLGLEKPISPRIATSQKCIRTGDIESVGKTDRHGTFFEMLGNFSFGDYFKKEIIPWAWEFVVDHLQLPTDRIWVSIYLDDDEAFEIWNKDVGIPAERIVRLGKEDNFWETGSGPCGPCSEIYIDRGPSFGCGEPDCKPGCDCERFLEFWNLVFIQFHQDGDSYTPLEAKSIDTGMGLERVAALLQGKTSIFDVDNIRPIIDGVGELAGVAYGSSAQTDMSLRVIVDHLRAVTFLVADGVLPSNEGRGYVLRRLLRRAVRHGRLLGITKPFAETVVDLVVKQMQAAYPELVERQEYVSNVVRLEEERFSATLEQGLRLLQDLVQDAKAAGQDVIAGKDAFQLYDTFGFPLDLTREILDHEGLTVDENGFQQAMEAQRERARKSRTAHGYLDSSLEAYKELAGVVTTEYIGYDCFETTAQIMGIIVDGHSVDTAEKGTQVAVVLDRTPFYAEGGGQIGDQGLIEADTGVVRVTDVRKPVEGLISHFGVVEEGYIAASSTVKASVAIELRQETARHHTATHLLHRALKDILGDHVNQAGSYVGPQRLRFDFTHFQAVSPAELAAIEEEVNRQVLRNSPVMPSITDLESAKEQGAVALFGEKYGEQVRMIQVGDYSLELCGGTHVKATGEIGLFKIVSEGSVAAGVRRIEAVVGREALAQIRAQEQVLQTLQTTLQSQAEQLPEQVERLLEANRRLEKELAELKKQNLLGSLDDLLSSAEKVGSASLVVAEVVAQDPEELRELGDRLRDHLDPAAILLGAKNGDKVLLLSMVSKSLTQSGIHAGNAVKNAAKICGGGGGGRPDMAQAGGRLPEKLPEALEEGRKYFRTLLEGIIQ
ncbi:MAG TPA: alanine--tRNA ligase [Firmicutes bacterium]|jgi:alanyl-tRNA synthetase|nr:alanine--tRNA ligase [Bacillota bacterium]HHT42372.1 alanine--tRNA ligase [Bacillota bacterium]